MPVRDPPGGIISVCGTGEDKDLIREDFITYFFAKSAPQKT